MAQPTTENQQLIKVSQVPNKVNFIHYRTDPASLEAENMRRQAGIWRSYDDIDVLSVGTVKALQDQRGYLWIGDTSGLHRYDGIEFISYTTDNGLVDNIVLAMHEDPQGKLWIGTSKGVSCLYDGKFINYTVDDGLAARNIRSICGDSDGRLWFGTLIGGVSCFDGERFTTYTTGDGLINDNILSIYEDRKGRMWFGTEGGVSCFDGERFRNYYVDDGLVGNLVRCICEDNNGNLWFSTQSGVSCFNGKSISNYTIKDGLPSNDVRGICKDRQGRLWFGTRSGVSCFDGDRFTNYTTQHGLLDDHVSYITQDREGLFWFSSSQGGLACFDPRTLRHLSSEPVTQVLTQAPSGRLWFNNASKLCCLFEGNRSSRTLDVDLFDILEDSQNRLWIGTIGNGLYCYDPPETVWGEREQQSVLGSHLDSNIALSIIETRDGVIWVGTANPGSFCRFDGSKFEMIPTPHSAILRILEDKEGRIWAIGGSKGKGVSCYDGKEFVNYTMEDGLPSDSTHSIVEDDAGHIWIGTQKGLCRFDGENFTTYGKEQELSSLSHKCAARDASGQLWFGTLRGGVYRTDGRHFQVLTTEDDLPSNSINGLLPQPDGSMIIGTYRGIVQYRSSANVPPLIEIREVVADQVYKNPAEMELTVTEADLLTISYHGLSFATRRMRYSYILEGYDEEWHETWNSRIRYENLPVGEYTFKVIAINRDLVCSEAPAVLKFSIVQDRWNQLRAEYEAEIGRMRKLLELIRHVNNQETLSDTAYALVEALCELGFDRAGVWFRDAGDEYARGLWGVDLNGNIYNNEDEQRLSDTFPPDHGYNIELGKSILRDNPEIKESHIFLFRDQDEDIFESVWGYPPPCPGYYSRDENGDNICLSINLEDEKAVIIAVDNHITKRPIDETSANFLNLVATEMAKVMVNVALRESLERSEVKSRAILDAIPDLMFRITQDGVLLDYKADNEGKLYVPVQKNIGGNIRDILPPEIADLTLHYIREALNSTAIQFFEYQLPAPEGLWSYEARLVVSGEDEVLAVIRNITDRKLAEEREREYIHDLEFLSKTAMGFVEFPSEGDVYQFIAEKLKELVGDSIVAICEFVSDSDRLYVRAILGLNEHSKTVFEILGRNPIGMSVKSSDIVSHSLTSGKLVRLHGNIHECCSEFITMEASRKLEEILHLNKIYSMGLATEGKPFGAAFIFTRVENELRNQDAIETFINQASVALQRRQAEEHIKESLAEKEVLLKEIHHRVKNNLQIISSLLNLQSGYVEDDSTLQMFRESQNRVRSMALIHEKLYRSGDLARVDFAEYIRDLANYLFRIYSSSSMGINLKIKIDDVLLDIDRAISCGLIVNELVSNSLKHAFKWDAPGDNRGYPRGEISVELYSESDEKLALMVSDNGSGFPEEVDFQETESLGLQLVNTLADQIDGEIELDRSHGTAFKIIFAQPE